MTDTADINTFMTFIHKLQHICNLSYSHRAISLGTSLWTMMTEDERISCIHSSCQTTSSECLDVATSTEDIKQHIIPGGTTSLNVDHETPTLSVPVAEVLKPVQVSAY